VRGLDENHQVIMREAHAVFWRFTPERHLTQTRGSSYIVVFQDAYNYLMDNIVLNVIRYPDSVNLDVLARTSAGFLGGGIPSEDASELDSDSSSKSSSDSLD
jgi:hypothetical protein